MITQYSYGKNVAANLGNNVIDEFKPYDNETIREKLKATQKDFVAVLYNVDHDLNIATSIRSANAFGGKEVYIVGRRRYDRRGCVGVYHYTDTYHSDSFIEVYDKLKSEGYTVIAVDNIPEYAPQSVYGFSFPEKSAFVFGNENEGLPQEAIQQADVMIYIPQSGSVRSLNVATASAVVMSHYCGQFS